VRQTWWARDASWGLIFFFILPASPSLSSTSFTGRLQISHISVVADGDGSVCKVLDESDVVCDDFGRTRLR